MTTSEAPAKSSSPKFLLRHVGNMGDMIFIVPPVLSALKSTYPHCHITFVTSWGYKRTVGFIPPLKQTIWGQRNQSGHSLHLIMTNPHIDQLVHWHDKKLSLTGRLCQEDGHSFPTWSKDYYEQQIKSGIYDKVIELDFGLSVTDNPVVRAFQLAGISPNHPFNYQIYFTDSDLQKARALMTKLPQPRIVLLESLAHPSTRGWTTAKVKQLTAAIIKEYGVEPIWFGSKFGHFFNGQPLSLRENIATLRYCSVGIGVLSGPLHFAAAAGLPTITLYCDHPLRRAAPAFFQNPSLPDNAIKHRTILGPHKLPMTILKGDASSLPLTPDELTEQNFIHWSNPGRQSTKSGLAAITVDEVMTVLNDMLK
jgi:ADP-heptose:LPS heptosyltransferase